MVFFGGGVARSQLSRERGRYNGNTEIIVRIELLINRNHQIVLTPCPVTAEQFKISYRCGTIYR